MKIETTTQLLPILDVGMYESALSPANMFSFEIEHLASDNKEEIGFNFDKYQNDVCKEADKIIQEYFVESLQKFGVQGINCVSISSPKFYNYTTDCGNLDLEVSGEFFGIMKGWLKGNCQASEWEVETNKWLKEYYGSCSGFISFMPTTVKELIECDDIERCVSVYLTLVLLQEESLFFEYGNLKSSPQDNFENSVMESLSYGEYATLRDIYEPTLWEMYLTHPDTLNSLIWDLFYKGVIRCMDITRTTIQNEMERFMQWATDKGYTYEDLISLANN